MNALTALLPYAVPPHRRALVALPDLTRPIDAVAALAAFEAWLPSGSERVAIVGLGLHRPLTPAELAPLRAVWSGEVKNHDPDNWISLAAEGDIPVTLNPEVARCDLRLTAGVVELHQYAGFSGGYKGIVVGLGGRPTLDALHHRRVVTDPQVIVGRLSPNPFREAIDRIGARVGVYLALQWNGRAWFAGPPSFAMRDAAAELDGWYTVSRRYSQVILKVPRVKAVNFYQASRAATYLALSPHPPLNPGARLILEAACPEGMGQGSGEQAFAEVLRNTPVWTDIFGQELPGAGTQRALMLARLAQRYTLEITGCESAAILRAHHIPARAEPATAGPDTLVVEDAFQLLPQFEQIHV